MSFPLGAINRPHSYNYPDRGMLIHFLGQVLFSWVAGVVFPAANLRGLACARRLAYPPYPALPNPALPDSRIRWMWKWLRSLCSRLFSEPDRASGQISRFPTSSRNSARAQPDVRPTAAEKLPWLDWQPRLHATHDEETVAPPLTVGSADHAPILGIDLGTSHSVVAVVRQGKVEVIPNQEGEFLTPSVVAFARDGQVLVGSRALRQAALNPQRTVYGIKRHLRRMPIGDE